MSTAGAGLEAAARNSRLTSRVRRHLRELYLEQRLRTALRVKPVRLPLFRLPHITLHGDFTRLPECRMLRTAFADAINDVGGPSDEVRQIEGMSGQRYRTLINSLVRYHPHARYLEVGSWNGSTAASAMCGNSLDVLCIDNWSQFGGSKPAFLENIEQVRSPTVNFRFIESDFRKIDYGSIGTFNIYLFDGPHEELDQYDGIMLARSALDRRVIIVVDDWNWLRVRMGTFRALLNARYQVEASIEIRTAWGSHAHALTHGKHSDWHNGYFIAVCATA